MTSDPHFLWVTQFPLFTRADEDKEELAKGRWASSHHPFTAPMWEDMKALKKGDVEGVSGPRTVVLSFRNQKVSGSLGSTAYFSKHWLTKYRSGDSTTIWSSMARRSAVDRSECMMPSYRNTS